MGEGRYIFLTVQPPCHHSPCCFLRPKSPRIDCSGRKALHWDVFIYCICFFISAYSSVAAVLQITARQHILVFHPTPHMPCIPRHVPSLTSARIPTRPCSSCPRSPTRPCSPSHLRPVPPACSPARPCSPTHPRRSCVHAAPTPTRRLTRPHSPAHLPIPTRRPSTARHRLPAPTHSQHAWGVRPRRSSEGPRAAPYRTRVHASLVGTHCLRRLPPPPHICNQTGISYYR